MTSPVTLSLRVSGEVIFVFQTLTKVHPPPTTKLETNTQADKMPAISPRLGVKIFHSRRSPKLMNTQTTQQIRLREPFEISNIACKINSFQCHLPLKNETIMYLGEHDLRTRHLKYKHVK